MSIITSGRAWLAREIRAKVAGPRAAEVAQDIWGADGPRRFASGDPIWRVHADASMFVGGFRAILFQTLHPLAMAAVADHSGYRGDPWGRLERTSHFIATTTFAPTDRADAMVRAVRGIHDRITGTAPDGRPYAASDPHLLRWVHVAEVDSFLHTYQLFGSGKLSQSEADEYVAQAACVAEGLGATDVPHSVEELNETLRSYREELECTPAARDTVRFLLLNPPLPLAARAGYGLLAAGAVGTLPSYAREMLGLKPVHDMWHAPSRLMGLAGAASVRWIMSDPSVAH